MKRAKLPRVHPDQQVLVFDAETGVGGVVGESLFDLLTDARPPQSPVDGIGDVAMGQAFLDAPRASGARRLGLPIDQPCDTVMAGGVGDVNTSQYTLVDAPPAGTDAGPSYRIPLMTEIAAGPKNGLTVVSTFSGCGGSCLGFKMAGYRVLWANEFVPAAQDTYRANHPDTHLDTSDIRAVTAASIRAVIGDVDVDVLEGSPPCASFSTAGSLDAGWGKVRKYSDVEQRTDDLFDQYVRILDGLRPRAFVAENVSGLVKGVSKGHFKRYLKLFRGLPYIVEARLLDAQYLGVPQRRVRLIFVGVRKDVGRRPAWPRKLTYRYSVRDAIPWIADAARVIGDGVFPDHVGKIDEPMATVVQKPGGRIPQIETRVIGGGAAPGRAKGEIFSSDEPLPTITGRERQQFFVEQRVVEPESALGPAVGAEWDKLEPGEQSERYMNLILPTEDEPCPTVTAIGGTPAAAVAHPYERRKFTIAELRRICGFPDDFVLTGTYARQWERLGRAVPPPMMAAIARALAPVLAPERTDE